MLPYNSLNAFRFVNAAGISTPVRWSMAPVRSPSQPERLPPARSRTRTIFSTPMAAIDQRADAMAPDRHRRPAGRSDRRCKTPVAGDREQVDAGTLTIDQVEARSGGQVPRHQFRPAGVARRHRAFGRSVAEPAIGRLFAVVHPARRRAKEAQRDHTADNRGKGTVSMMQPTTVHRSSRGSCIGRWRS